MAPGTPTRGKVKDLTKKGNTPRQIALILGISIQAVYQHIERLRKDGELPTTEAAS